MSIKGPISMLMTVAMATVVRTSPSFQWVWWTPVQVFRVRISLTRPLTAVVLLRALRSCEPLIDPSPGLSLRLALIFSTAKPSLHHRVHERNSLSATANATRAISIPESPAPSPQSAYSSDRKSVV